MYTNRFLKSACLSIVLIAVHTLAFACDRDDEKSPDGKAHVRYISPSVPGSPLKKTNINRRGTPKIILKRPVSAGVLNTSFGNVASSLDTLMAGLGPAFRVILFPHFTLSDYVRLSLTCKGVRETLHFNFLEGPYFSVKYPDNNYSQKYPWLWSIIDTAISQGVFKKEKAAHLLPGLVCLDNAAPERRKDIELKYLELACVPDWAIVISKKIAIAPYVPYFFNNAMDKQKKIGIIKGLLKFSPEQIDTIGGICKVAEVAFNKDKDFNRDKGALLAMLLNNNPRAIGPLVGWMSGVNKKDPDLKDARTHIKGIKSVKRFQELLSRRLYGSKYSESTSAAGQILYLKAIQHVGLYKSKIKIKSWTFPIEMLYEESKGVTFKEFESQVKKIIKEQNIPGYVVEWIEKADCPISVRLTNKRINESL